MEAPDIARKARAGQFIILRLDKQGERIPITLADWDRDRGTLTLYVQVVGKTTLQMSRLNPGDSILDVVGPLGVPSRIEKVGTVVGVGGGFGIAALYPILRDHSRTGNRTLGIIGAKTRDRLILEEEMRAACSDLRIATEDGSTGCKGLVTDVLKDLLRDEEPIDLALAIGPLIMMKTVADLTRFYNIPTLVSMNPLMMDGTGLCGACRVSVGGEMKFACVDGPEFDGHLIDFDEVMDRMSIYRREEKLALERYLRETECRLDRKLEEEKVR